MLETYRQLAAKRAEQGIPALPLTAEQTQGLVELLMAPPKGEEAFLLDLITNRVPPGVDDAARVKAGFLDSLARMEKASRGNDFSRQLLALHLHPIYKSAHHFSWH